MTDGLERIGKGNTAEVFAYSDSKALKLFVKGYPKDAVEREFANAKALFVRGVPVPEAYEIMETDGRCGILYERIVGKSLLDALEAGETDAESVLEAQVRLHRALLEKHTDAVLSYKEFLCGSLSARGMQDPALTARIQALPDGDTLLHGDLHPGNLLRRSDGSMVLIDFMNVCRGPALYDIARSFFLLGVSPALAEEYLRRMQATREEIAPFLSVIKDCRSAEMQG